MDNIKEKFDYEYIDTIWERILFWFWIRKIRRQKVVALMESNLDKLFMETEQQEWLSYDDTKDRAALAEENRKPIDQHDYAKIAELEEKISTAKAVKGAYYKNERFHNEVRTYIIMLDKWIKPTPQEPEGFGHSDL